MIEPDQSATSTGAMMNRQAIFAAMPDGLQKLTVSFIETVGLMTVDPRSWDAAAVEKLRRVAELDAARLFRDPDFGQEWDRLLPEIDSLRITDKAFAVNPGDRRAIYYLVRGMGVQSILEIGTHIGGSTLHFAFALRQNRNRLGLIPELVTVDIIDVNDPVKQPWIGWGSVFAPADMISRARCDDFTTFVTMNSLDYYPTCRRTFDLVFIDSSHSAKATWIEVVAAMKVLNDRGVILLHDYYPEMRRLFPSERAIPGPYRAMRHLRKLPSGSQLKVVPLGELPWPTRQGSCMTSLALVMRV